MATKQQVDTALSQTVPESLTVRGIDGKVPIANIHISGNNKTLKRQLLQIFLRLLIFEFVNMVGET